MVTIVAADASKPLAVREPRQRRTREQWERILNSGVELLQEGGYDAFTIPALCHRSGVPPRALYARADSKEALFLAVYEFGMRGLLADHDALADPATWQDLEGRALVERAVRGVAGIFRDHRRLLRAVVLMSGAHDEVARRGASYRADLGRVFTAALEPLDADSTHQDPSAAREFAFTLVFSSLVVATAYGAPFGAVDDTEQLVDAVAKYLIG